MLMSALGRLLACLRWTASSIGPLAKGFLFTGNELLAPLQAASIFAMLATHCSYGGHLKGCEKHIKSE